MEWCRATGNTAETNLEEIEKARNKVTLVRANAESLRGVSHEWRVPESGEALDEIGVWTLGETTSSPGWWPYRFPVLMVLPVLLVLVAVEAVEAVVVVIRFSWSTKN
jgi:hypothetical protein